MSEIDDWLITCDNCMTIQPKRNVGVQQCKECGIVIGGTRLRALKGGKFGKRETSEIGEIILAIVFVAFCVTLIIAALAYEIYP